MFRKDTHQQGESVVVCVFKADAVVPAVAFSSPEVKIRRASQLAVGEGISPVGVFVTDALCADGAQQDAAALSHRADRKYYVVFVYFLDYSCSYLGHLFLN